MEKSKELKLRCRNQLRPLMEMLLHKRAEIDNDHWKNLVIKTEKSIIDFPEQYLSEPAKGSLLDATVHELFKEFIEQIPNDSLREG